MSVTFAVEPVFTGRIIVKGWAWESCDVEPEVLASFPTHDAYRAHMDTEGEFAWPAYDWCLSHETITEGTPEVNMANANARDVLAALGLATDDLCGTEDAATFRARVLVTMAGYEGGDARPASVTHVEGAATVYDMGRAEGYIAQRLAALLAVAEAAEECGLAVVWS